MDTIEFTSWVAEQAIPDDKPGIDEVELEELLADMSDEALFSYLSTLREIVKKAREVRDEALADYDNDSLHLAAAMGVDNGSVF